jgi:DNA-directed RNA polymerase alpha subunit
MILDKMYNLLIDDIRQKINDDLAKTLDERDAQYHHFFKKIELIAQKVNELHLRVNSLSKFDRGNIEQFISDNQRLINSYSEGVHNVYKEFQEFKEEVSKAFNAVNVMLPEKNKNAHIDDLDLTVRTRNCLLSVNICTIVELCDQTSRNLLKIPNFGKKCLREVREALATFGLVLKDY